MLVLSRKVNQKITLTLPDGREAVVMVLKNTGGKVSLGILAPSDVTVIRTELQARDLERVA